MKKFDDVHKATGGEVDLNDTAATLVMGADNALVVRLGHDDAVVVNRRFNMENEELDGERLQSANVAIGTSPPSHTVHVSHLSPQTMPMPHLEEASTLIQGREVLPEEHGCGTGWD
jgi:hypothetical protein